MAVTGQAVFTERSKVMTGSFLQASSTAGVTAAEVLGETISASHLPLLTSERMSEICFSSLPWASVYSKPLMSALFSSTSACMVFQPTTRQGLLTLALEKHSVTGPFFLYLLVSTGVPPMCCSQGWSAGPSGLAAIRRTCSSKALSTSTLATWARAPNRMDRAARARLAALRRGWVVGMLRSPLGWKKWQDGECPGKGGAGGPPPPPRAQPRELLGR